jgi:putative phage-type endonuclease
MPKIYKELTQGTPAWLQHRLGKFGGTDAQAVATAGKGLDTKCYKKVAEILTGRGKTAYLNEDMERGNELEEVARQIYEIQTGNKVETVGYVEINEYVGCSPDGLVEDDGLIEVKCPNDANFVRFVHDKKIDTGYVWQMQHQMLVTERKWCDYVVFNDNLNKIEIVRVERDEEAIAKIEKGLEEGVKKIKKILSEVGLERSAQKESDWITAR